MDPIFSQIILAGHDLRLLTNFECLYTQIKILGYGSYGVVSLYSTQNGEVAIKEIKLKRTSEQINTLQHEILMIDQISQLTPAINKLVDHFIIHTNDNYYMWIVLEYIEGQTLEKYIQNILTLRCGSRGRKIPDNTIKDVAKWLFGVLNILHQNGYVHRDIKPRNIMIRAGGYTLIDFGMTCKTSGPSNNKAQGTPGYLAPELILGKNHDLEPTDIWSAGITLYELAELKFPWKEKLVSNVYKEICLGPDITMTHANDQLTSLIKWILTRNPSDRPTASEILDKITVIEV